jgi:hypothetical protein
MVEVILGAITACCSGKTIASAVIIWSMEDREAAVTCTAMIGSFSFSAEWQPVVKANTSEHSNIADQRRYLFTDFIEWVSLDKRVSGESLQIRQRDPEFQSAILIRRIG